MNRENTQDSTLARSESLLPTWSPVREFTDLRRQMDDLFSRAFGYTPLSSIIPNWTGAFQPEPDIYETEDQVLVFCPLPGFEPGEIDVQATDNGITIKGERKALYENEHARQHRYGAATGSCQFKTTFMLPSEIDPNKINATFKNGILQIEAPKSERAKTKTVKVSVR